MIFKLSAICALIAPFFLPWPYTVILTAVALLRYPVIAFAVGLELDALYFSPSAAFIPIATLWGILAMIVSLLIRRFVRVHIAIT